MSKSVSRLSNRQMSDLNYDKLTFELPMRLPANSLSMLEVSWLLSVTNAARPLTGFQVPL